MSKHTPGPWINGGEGRSIGRNEEMTFLFALTQSRVTKKEQRANALLATSAPDLLEALENLLDWFGDDRREWDGWEGVNEMLGFVEQAIAKAKGETHE